MTAVQLYCMLVFSFFDIGKIGNVLRICWLNEFHGWKLLSEMFSEVFVRSKSADQHYGLLRIVNSLFTFTAGKYGDLHPLMTCHGY